MSHQSSAKRQRRQVVVASILFVAVACGFIARPIVAPAKQSSIYASGGRLLTGGFMLPEVTGGEALLYVSDSRGDKVEIFPQRRGHAQGPIGEITGLNYPTGVAVNRSGDVFVQVTGGSSPGILGFHRGSTTPFTALTGGGGVALAFDRNGNVYAGTTTNEVDVYSPGATHPTSRFHDHGLTLIWSITVDYQGNIFCSGAKTQGSVGDTYPVDEVRKDGRQAFLFGLTSFGGDLGLGRDGELVVQDQGYKTITFYKKPFRKQLVVSRVTYTADSIAMALTANRKQAWISSIYTPRGSEAQEYDFASGERARVTSGGDLGLVLEGVAVDPPAL